MKEGNVSGVFGSLTGQLEEEADLRDQIKTAMREVERGSREIGVGLSEIHMMNPVGSEQNAVAKIIQGAHTRFEVVRGHVGQLVKKVPLDQYYVFHDMWKFTFQKLAFAAALLVYLEQEQMATLQQVAAAIGVMSSRTEGFHLDLEDYLFGLLNLASELSRYCVNRVTAGDYKSPERIFAFITQLGAGFRLLNLKNNDLRRRFDSLKYDEKKVEEVIYDLSVRGLINKDLPLIPIATPDQRNVSSMQE